MIRKWISYNRRQCMYIDSVSVLNILSLQCHIGDGSLLNLQYLVCMSIKVKGGLKTFLAMEVLCKPDTRPHTAMLPIFQSGHLQDTCKIPQAHISN